MKSLPIIIYFTGATHGLHGARFHSTASGKYLTFGNNDSFSDSDKVIKAIIRAGDPHIHFSFTLNPAILHEYDCEVPWAQPAF